VIEADDIFATLAALTLNAHQFARVNVVAILWRVRPGVTAARDRGHNARAVIVHAPQQHTAAFVRIGFFTVPAESLVMYGCELQHVGNANVRSQNAEVTTGRFLFYFFISDF
jgi:hypothetical protein